MITMARGMAAAKAGTKHKSDSQNLETGVGSALRLGSPRPGVFPKRGW